MANRRDKNNELREKLYTPKEIADLLNVETRTIVEWVQYRRIPFVRVNNELIRFRISDIVDWVKSRQQAESRPKSVLR
jgi:excisionase family DNA binding protein